MVLGAIARIICNRQVGSVTVQRCWCLPHRVSATTTIGNVVANGDGAIDALGNAATGEIEHRL